MGHGYEPEFVGDKAFARLILAVLGLSGDIHRGRLPARLSAPKVRAQRFSQLCLPALRLCE